MNGGKIWSMSADPFVLKNMTTCNNDFVSSPYAKFASWRNVVGVKNEGYSCVAQKSQIATYHVKFTCGIYQVN